MLGSRVGVKEVREGVDDLNDSGIHQDPASFQSLFPFLYSSLCDSKMAGAHLKRPIGTVEAFLKIMEETFP